MKKRKYIKLMSIMLVFLLTFSLNIDINIGNNGTSSSPNKHFIQLGMGEVEAAPNKTVQTITLNNHRISTTHKIDGSGSSSVDSYTYNRFTVGRNYNIKEKTYVKITGSVSWRDVGFSSSMGSGDYPWGIYLDLINYDYMEYQTYISKDTKQPYIKNGTKYINTTVYYDPYYNERDKTWENEIYISIETATSGGYYSTRTWWSEVYVDANLTIEYEANNTNPKLNLASPTLNSPLQGRQAYMKGAV